MEVSKKKIKEKTQMWTEDERAGYSNIMLEGLKLELSKA